MWAVRPKRTFESDDDLKHAVGLPHLELKLLALIGNRVVGAVCSTFDAARRAHFKRTL